MYVHTHKHAPTASLSVDGHLGYFYILAVVNNATRNIEMHILKAGSFLLLRIILEWIHVQGLESTLF